MAMLRDEERIMPARARLPSLSRLTGQVDLSVLMGIGGAIALLAIAIGASGSIAAFVDVPSMLIVLGGTAAVTAAGYAPSDIAHAVAAAARTLLRATHSTAEVATDILELAAEARAGGVAALRRALEGRHPDDKLRRSLALAAAGLPVDGIQALIERETNAAIQRLGTAAGILRRAADVAPAMGLIGTLIGLVQMLGVLDTPSKIGPGMALALLTTLYGAVLAHLVLLPLAARLDRAAEDDERVAQLCRLGAVSIARQESLNTLEMQLNSALPPADRPRYAD
ncbi:MAG: MotA/TolQ/ExbB proton channel family protein [Alphaproteobacteria bacterium]|nr:MotA/TolQ/ExbB proton channel family protein [Alphaproteobacteria bacterium]